MSKPLFRCSRLAELMAGRTELGSTDLKTLEAIYSKISQGKTLTEKQQADKEAIEAKKAFYENEGITDGAKTFVHDTFLQNEYGYREEITNDDLKKGKKYESQAATMLSDYLGNKEFVKINRQQFSNDWICGMPDIILSDTIPDIKVPKNLKTWSRAKLSPQYLWQLTGYCMLTNKPNAMLVYCLIKDDEQRIQAMTKKLWMQHGYPEQSQDDAEMMERYREYEKAERQIIANNEAIEKVKNRVRTFTFQPQQSDFDKIKIAVEKAQKYYEVLKSEFDCEQVKTK